MTDLIPESTVAMGTWHQDNTIDLSAFDWQEATVERLQVGSRFRVIKEKYNIHDLFVVLHIPNHQSIQVFASEWIDGKGFETSFQNLSLEASDPVLVIPDHERSIALSEASHE